MAGVKPSSSGARICVNLKIFLILHVADGRKTSGVLSMWSGVFLLLLCSKDHFFLV